MKNSTKTAYRVRNWKQYNAALVGRGSLTIWLNQSVLDEWITTERSGKPGASNRYSDQAIIAALTLGAVYRLPLRQTEGLIRSIMTMLGCQLAVPTYSTLSRRRPGLQITLNYQSSQQPLDLLIDSTGVKLYGEGEWKVRIHGKGKRRGWIKLHIGLNAASQQIVAAVVSTHNVSDGDCFAEILEQLDDPIASIRADGAYDQHKVYDVINEYNRQRDIQQQPEPMHAVIPPKRGSVIWQHGNCNSPPIDRDEHLRSIRSQGRGQWKRQSGYHQRSLAETAMYRLKSIFGRAVRARGFDARAVEMFIRGAALNAMTQLGMPESYPIT